MSNQTDFKYTNRATDDLISYIFYSRQFPQLKWAQRKEKVFMTVDVPDCENIEIDLTDAGVLNFK